jgi:hypothetical protein
LEIEGKNGAAVILGLNPNPFHSRVRKYPGNHFKKGATFVIQELDNLKDWGK